VLYALVCEIEATENAGVEKASRSNTQGWKMRQWKTSSPPLVKISLS